MTLTLKSKTPVRFEHTDGTAETAVVLQPDDSEEVLARKLQRVLELTGDGLPRRQPGAALAAAVAEFPPLWDAEAAEAALLQQQKTGWEALASDDDLPEA